MDNYYSPYAGGMFRQLKSKSQEIQVEKLDVKLTNWAKKNGISIESLKSVVEKFPDRYENSSLGVADFAKGLIAIADNRNIDTLAEELRQVPQKQNDPFNIIWPDGIVIPK